VSTFSKRTLYLTATALILGAIAAEFLSKYHAGRGMKALARRAEIRNAKRAAGLSVEGTGLRDEAAAHARRSACWGAIGLGLATLAIGVRVASRQRCEPGLHGLFLGLLGLYVFLLFLIV
jgi:hypothetical protein